MSKSAEDRIEEFLMAPFHIWDIAKRVVTSSNGSAKRIEEKETAPEAVKSPPPVTFDGYTVADKVHSQMFGQLKVCFYHHYKAKVIRIVARKNGFVKEVLFTPSIADERCTPFGMDSAVAFVREVGFSRTNLQAPQLAGSTTENANALAPSQGRPHASSSQRQATKPVQLKGANTMDAAPHRNAKNRPFTGHILGLGETTRPGREGNAPYTTYFIKLRSEGDHLEKEFFGEHLAELAEKNELQRGQLIRLQLLGRNRFEVETAGRIEERYRNEYSLEIIG